MHARRILSPRQSSGQSKAFKASSPLLIWSVECVESFNGYRIEASRFCEGQERVEVVLEIMTVKAAVARKRKGV